MKSEKVKQRATAVRLRTWTLTLSIVIALVFYFLVQTVIKGDVDLIGFAITCVLQIVLHCMYFPEGELAGQRNETFIANREAYNEKATLITREKKIERLREYCKFEYDRRKRDYIEIKCGALGITMDEFDVLKQLSVKEIKKLDKYDFGDKVITFSRHKRRALYRLIFKPIPVEENSPSTIMSAVEKDDSRAVRDESIVNKRAAYLRIVIKAVFIGLFMAYIGYSWRNGITFEQIVELVTNLTTMFTTAVFSYSKGENEMKIYKCRFYIDLANFIDGFFEWDDKVVVVQPPTDASSGI